MVMVLGPAGIGKSRLARRACIGARGRSGRRDGTMPPVRKRHHVLASGRADRDLGGIEAAEALFAGTDDGDIVVERLRAATGAADTVAPSTEVFWAVRRLLERMSEHRPLLVTLEDLHWAEPTMLDLVEYVAAFASGPLVLLCIARPELLETRPSLGTSRLELEQLSDTRDLRARRGARDPRRRSRGAGSPRPPRAIRSSPSSWPR